MKTTIRSADYKDPRKPSHSLEDFRPLPILVDSTRRKFLIRWQKRAAMWKHGFESRWGHHMKSRNSPNVDARYALVCAQRDTDRNRNRPKRP